jgi:hypothetical protein
MAHLCLAVIVVCVWCREVEAEFALLAKSHHVERKGDYKGTTCIDTYPYTKHVTGDASFLKSVDSV